MSDFDAFFAQNAVKIEDTKVVVSKRFIDGEGKPIPWVLHPIDESVNQKLKAAATKKTGKRSEIDGDTYICKMVVATVASPDLNNKGIQDSYGVMDAEALIRKMLTAGEYTNLMTKVQEVNGFDLDMNELVEEAKN